MKTITIKGQSLRIPNRFIAAAYAGACAAHQVHCHEKVWGFKVVDWLKDFKYLYRLIYRSNSRGVVRDLPSRMTFKELVDNSPANVIFGGM